MIEASREAVFPVGIAIVDAADRATGNDLTRRNVATRGPVEADVEDRAADLEVAIGRLTTALAIADDDAIAELVAERAAMRSELRSLRTASAGNVIPMARRER